MGLSRKLIHLSLGALVSMSFVACSGKGDPPTEPSPTPVVTATPSPDSESEVESSPERAPDPNFSPLGGKPLTEEEAEYYRQQKKAEDFALAGNYREAIPILEAAVEQMPEDPKNYFYLLLSYGGQEHSPTKDSEAFEAAEKVLELAPKSNFANKAQSYIAASKFSLPDGFAYTVDTMKSMGPWVTDPDAVYALNADALFHPGLPPRLTPGQRALLWETEVEPERTSTALPLKKGQMFHILTTQSFYYGLTSWLRPLPPEPKRFNDTHFNVQIFYIELAGEGENAGKKGWIVNHVDHFIDREGGDPWGVWISNRGLVPRKADLDANK